jgi:hypothetical protein
MESDLQIFCNAYDSTWLNVPFTNIPIINEWLMVFHNWTHIADFIDHEVYMFPGFNFEEILNLKSESSNSTCVACYMHIYSNTQNGHRKLAVKNLKVIPPDVKFWGDSEYSIPGLDSACTFYCVLHYIPNGVKSDPFHTILGIVKCTDRIKTWDLNILNILKISHLVVLLLTFHCRLSMTIFGISA